MVETNILLILNVALLFSVLYYAKKKGHIGLFFITIIISLYQIWGYFLFLNFPQLSWMFDIGNIVTNTANVTVTLRLFFLSNMIFFIVYFLVFKVPKHEYISVFNQQDYFYINQKSILKYFLFISLLGLMALFLQVVMSGGFFARAQDRVETYQFAGLLSLIAKWAILYPLVKYYITKKLDTLILMFLILIFFSGIVTGTSTATLTSILPFFIFFIFQNRDKFSYKSIFSIAIIGYLTLTFLRFGRYAASQYYSGNEISFIDFILASEEQRTDQAMQLSVQGSIDGFAPMLSIVTHFDNLHQHYDLYGQSYINAIVLFIPGIIAPWKTDFLNFYKPDFILGEYLSNLHRINYMNLLPSGFWGEAYMNFGIAGLIVFSIFIAYWMAKNEKLFHKFSYRIIPPPLLASIIIGSFILMCRMYFSVYIFNIFTLLLPFFFYYLLPKRPKRYL